MIIDSKKEFLPPADSGFRWVLMSNELADQLSQEWSAPVRFRVRLHDNGDITMEFRKDWP